jgi:hypothetical protein
MSTQTQHTKCYLDHAIVCVRWGCVREQLFQQQRISITHTTHTTHVTKHTQNDTPTIQTHNALAQSLHGFDEERVEGETVESCALVVVVDEPRQHLNAQLWVRSCSNLQLSPLNVRTGLPALNRS